MPQKGRHSQPVSRSLMLDFAAARRMMVDGQVRTQDVTSLDLIAAMLEVPRERFVPPARAQLAYLDLDVAVSEPGQGGPARHLLKAMVLAKLLQAADLQPTDSVLDVGCATGYSSAILARLVHSVVAVEEDRGLARMAEQNLLALGCANASVVSGPLRDGCADRAPYDVILMNGAVEVVPDGLCRQLKDGGRLLCVFRRAPGGKAMLYRSDRGEISGRPVFDAAAPLLQGFEKPAAFVF
jgi:protein-L-isoaspartate(D-aspartate) O-methyltransferase